MEGWGAAAAAAWEETATVAVAERAATAATGWAGAVVAALAGAAAAEKAAVAVAATEAAVEGGSVAAAEGAMEAVAVAAAAAEKAAGQAAGWEEAAAAVKGAAVGAGWEAAGEEATEAAQGAGWEAGSEEGSAAAAQGGRSRLHCRCRTVWCRRCRFLACRWGRMREDHTVHAGEGIEIDQHRLCARQQLHREVGHLDTAQAADNAQLQRAAGQRGRVHVCHIEGDAVAAGHLRRQAAWVDCDAIWRHNCRLIHCIAGAGRAGGNESASRPSECDAGGAAIAIWHRLPSSQVVEHEAWHWRRAQRRGWRRAAGRLRGRPWRR